VVIDTLASCKMKSLAQMRKEIMSRPPAEDLIQDLLPDSSSAYMLICGRSGIGKTFLALNMLFCLATGEPFLSHKTKPCKVGYLSMEGSDQKILNRFDAISYSFPSNAKENIYWKHTTAITLTDAGLLHLEELITGLDVVIMDPLRPLIAGDYTSPKDANTFLKRLQRLQNETSTRLVLIHHIRKPDKRHKVQPEDLQFEVKGAAEYVEAATTVVLLERASQPKDSFGRFLNSSDDRLLHFVKVKDSPTDLRPIALRFDRERMLFLPLIDEFPIEDLTYSKRVNGLNGVNG
jgi:RecA-family ATPase